MTRNCYCALFFLLLSFTASAQKDTLFWFAAPEVSEGYLSFDKPIRFFITTYNQPATVTISQPAGGGMPPQTVTIATNTSQSVDVTAWITSIENTPADMVLNYGLKIESTTHITVYYEVVSLQCLCNPEIFVLKGINALGMSFLIPSQTIADNNSTYFPEPYSSFDIVATENNTTITINPSNPIVGHAAGVPFALTLNKGQTYSATATGQTGTLHLQGSTVISDKPVAITVKDDLLTGPYNGCADLAGDQIVPITIIGSEYIAMQGSLNSPFDFIYVMASQNNTTISQNGVAAGMLNAGQTQQLSIGGSSTYIQSSAPVYVLQLSGIGCELSTSVLPQLECTGSDKVSFARSSPNDLYINLMVKNGGQGNFLVNGASGVVTAAQFAAVPGTGSQWFAAQVSLPLGSYPQNSVISVTNSTNLFHLGVLDGSAQTGARFGYFSNYGIVNPIVSTTTPHICAGETIYLFADPITGATYNWTGPNGFTSTIQNPVIPNATAADSGLYTLHVTANGCNNNTDINIIVYPRPIIDVVTDKDTICGSTVATLTASGADTYVWTPSSGLSSTTGNTVIASPASTTTYTVIGQSIHQCPDTAAITIVIGGQVHVTQNIEMCNDSSFMFGNQLISTGGSYTQNFVGLGGCDSIVTLNVLIINPPPPVTFEVNDICLGAEITITGSESGTYVYQWDFDNATVSNGSNEGPYSLSWNDTGIKVISVTISNICGSESYTDSLKVNDKPIARINNVEASGLCGGDSITLNAYSEPGYHYEWLADGELFGTDGPVTGLIPNEGYVILKVSNDFGCRASDSVYIMVDPCCIVALPTAFTPNGDGKNDIYKIITLGHNELVNFMIANRWGEIVFETKDVSKGWNGYYKGELADVGVYGYILRYKCHNGKIKERKGDVTLIR